MKFLELEKLLRNLDGYSARYEHLKILFCMTIQKENLWKKESGLYGDKIGLYLEGFHFLLSPRKIKLKFPTADLITASYIQVDLEELFLENYVNRRPEGISRSGTETIKIMHAIAYTLGLKRVILNDVSTLGPYSFPALRMILKQPTWYQKLGYKYLDSKGELKMRKLMTPELEDEVRQFMTQGGNIPSYDYFMAQEKRGSKFEELCLTYPLSHELSLNDLI